MSKKTAYIFILLIIAPFSVVLSASEKTTDYLAIMLQGKKAGYAVISRQVNEDKVTTTEEMNLTMSRAGTAITVKVIQICVETTKGDPISFKVIQDMSILSSIINGTIKDGQLTITTSGMGSAQTSTTPWPEGALLSEGLRLLSIEKGNKEATTYTAKAFDPSSQMAMDAEITVGPTKQIDLLGRVVELTEMKTLMNMPMAGNLETISYVDKNFAVKKSTTSIMGMSMEMLACDKEFAMSPPQLFDVMDKLFLKTPSPIKNVNQAKSIKYTLVKNAAASKTDSNIRLDIIPAIDNQTVISKSPEEAIVTVAPVKPANKTTIPYKGTDPNILEMLKPTEYLNSDNPLVIELAKKAIGNTKDAETAARKIESFVASYMVNKGLNVGYATAAEVAQSKQGDCSEFAVLTAAMLRSVGIPSRVAVGIAYVDQWGQFSQSFGGHAWTESYIGGKWIGLDAAFKSSELGGYNPGHIALAVGSGSPSDFFALVNTMGLFEIKEIEVKY